MARRDYAGNAAPAVLVASIGTGDLTFEISTASGWPSGGANGKFHVTMDQGQSNEEEMLVQVRAGAVCTIANIADRGLNGTVAASHTGGSAVVLHTFSVTDANEANQHINDTTQDHHGQYLNSARHAATVHTIGMMGTGSVGAAQIVDGSVGSAELATNSVTTVKITDANVTTAKILDANVTTAKIADANVTTGKIADLNVTSGKLAANAVTTAKILDANVTAAKLANGTIANGVMMATGQVLTYVQAADPGAVGANSLWYNTTTRLSLVRNAANTAWQYLPGQLLTRVTVTANQTSLGLGPMFLTGMEVTFDGLGGPVRIISRANIQASASDVTAVTTCRTAGGGIIIDTFGRAFIAGGGEAFVGGAVYETPAAGSTTRRTYYSGSAGDPDLLATATNTSYMEVWTA